MHSSGSRFVRATAACLAALALGLSFPATPSGVSATVAISQVYGGGGNSGAPYTHDFVELFNRGSVPVSLTGWSIQYASATGTGSFGSSPTLITELPDVTLQPGQYFLVQQASGSNGSPLPAPDFVDPTPIAMAAGAGKVALVTGTTSLGCNGGSTACDATQLARIVDLVGFGGANFFEGAGSTAALSNTTAALRASGGCTDSDDNSSDFAVGAPAPRTTTSPLNPCSGPPALSINDVSVVEGNDGTTVATFTVSLNSPAESGGVTFDIATADGTAAAAAGDYVARVLTGQTIPEGQQVFAFGVEVLGDTLIEPTETFSVQLTGVTGAVLARGQGAGTIINDDFAPPVFDVVISQIYGGGGNAGATYTHDFIELFNHGSAPVSLSGWSLQYTSAAGSGTWQTTPLTGTIQPGRYVLVQQAAGAAGTTPLPQPDVIGSIPLGAASGKVLLRSTPDPVAGACPADATIVDLVGFGTATCYEGASPAAQLSNTLAALRKRGGCFDSNDNAQDFSASAPAPRNSGSAARACSFQTAPIHAIQGDGLVTPFNGQDVTTSGIVTLLKTNGFFVQSADQAVDENPGTSEALFVFTSTAPPVSIGDVVTIQGTATEFFELTQIEATLPGAVTVTSTAQTLPAAVILTPDLLDPNGSPVQLEPLEGMRVTAAALVSVAPTNTFGEVYTVLSGVARPRREPGIEAGLPIPPDPVSGQVDCCIPSWDRNPERIMVDTDGAVGASPIYVTSNVTLTGVTGPLDFSFGDYKILPEAAPAVSAGMVPLVAPAPTPHEFTVASYNIENFNNDERQRRKAALHIRTVMRSPDVIGAVEIASLAALQALALQVNADALAAGEPDPQYQAHLIPSGTGTQHLGFLVKTSRVLVQSVAQQRAGDTFINPVTGQPETLHDRPPLVLDAIVDPAGDSPARVLVVVNHLRSFIDIEPVGGEGPRVRAKRTAQAEAVAELLQELQSSTPGVLVIAVGDYNAYEFNDGYTDPMAILSGVPTPDEQVVVPASPDVVDPDFINLTGQLSPEQRYTYIFEGTPQAIDHILINTVAARYVQRYVIARSNTDFPEAAAAGLFVDPTRPEANSDHDTPIAYFSFPGRPVVTLHGDPVMHVEAFTSFVDPGATAQDDDGPLGVTVSGSVDVNVPGTYTLRYTASNAHATTTVERRVIVADTIAPAIAGFAVSPSLYTGPPNHRMFDVLASYTATDASSAVGCALSVASNEPLNGIGDGSTNVDWYVVSPTAVQLRAERSGSGSGRVYTITVTCTDPSGNASSAARTVTIRK